MMVTRPNSREYLVFIQQLYLSWFAYCVTLASSSSSSRSHLVVGSLRQTQFSSSQFCHGARLSSFRWLSCLGWHSPSISASVFLAFFSRVVPSPESFFLRSLGLSSLRGQTTCVALSSTSLRYSLPSVSPWCFRSCKYKKNPKKFGYDTPHPPTPLSQKKFRKISKVINHEYLSWKREQRHSGAFRTFECSPKNVIK